MDELVCRYQRPYTLTTDSLEKSTGREILFYYIAGIFFFPLTQWLRKKKAILNIAL